TLSRIHRIFYDLLTYTPCNLLCSNIINLNMLRLNTNRQIRCTYTFRQIQTTNIRINLCFLVHQRCHLEHIAQYAYTFTHRSLISIKCSDDDQSSFFRITSTASSIIGLSFRYCVFDTGSTANSSAESAEPKPKLCATPRARNPSSSKSKVMCAR